MKPKEIDGNPNDSWLAGFGNLGDVMFRYGGCLKVVGACLARTATNSLKIALERLLGRPCYHMWEALEHPEHLPIWKSAVEGKHPAWNQFLGDYGATVDEPAAHFWRELSATYPDALILLSARDVDDWWNSCAQTVLPTVRELPAGPMKELMRPMWSPKFSFERYDERAAKAGYQRFIEHVRMHAPRDRLIEWHPGDGWAPLCDALCVATPIEPFPHVNTTAEFRERIPDRLGE